MIKIEAWKKIKFSYYEENKLEKYDIFRTFIKKWFYLSPKFLR